MVLKEITKLPYFYLWQFYSLLFFFNLFAPRLITAVLSFNNTSQQNMVVYCFILITILHKK